MVLCFILYLLLGAFPLYVCINLVLWLFHCTTHVTLVQAIGIFLLGTVINSMFVKKGGK